MPYPYPPYKFQKNQLMFPESWVSDHFLFPNDLIFIPNYAVPYTNLFFLKFINVCRMQSKYKFCFIFMLKQPVCEHFWSSLCIAKFKLKLKKIYVICSRGFEACKKVKISCWLFFIPCYGLSYSNTYTKFQKNQLSKYKAKCNVCYFHL